MNDDDKLFAEHGTLWPDVICGEDAEFFYILYWQALESGLDVFRIDVLAFFGDDHIFLSAAEVEVALRVEFAEVAGPQPSGNDRFGGEFGFIEVAGHHGLAADINFAHAVGAGIDDFNLHAGKRLAYGVSAKRF